MLKGTEASRKFHQRECRSNMATNISDVSVITVCYNASETIAQTIKSVHAASGPWLIEHIIVDGDSNDGTQDIVRAHLRPQDRFVSEPDDGISDAFNKGLSLARGNYVHFLNADDWASPGFWDTMLRVAKSENLAMAHSDLNLYNEAGTLLYRSLEGRSDYFKYLAQAMRGIFHPSLLVRKDVFNEVGVFDVSFKTAMDLEFLQRAEWKGFRSSYVPGARVHFRSGGASYSNIRRSAYEANLLAKRSGIPLLKRLNGNVARIVRLSYRILYVRVFKCMS